MRICSCCGATESKSSWYHSKEGNGFWCVHCYAKWKWKTDYKNFKTISKEHHLIYTKMYNNHRKAREIYLRSITPEKLLQIVETGEILV